MNDLNTNPEENPGHRGDNRESDNLSEFEKSLLSEAGPQSEPPPDDVGEDPAITVRRELIIEHAPQMIEAFGGRAFASARHIENWLESRGSIREFEDFTGWADGTGGYGLHLPYVLWKGRPFYDLKMVSASAEEKAARQEALAKVRASVIEQIIVTVPMF